VQVLEHVVERLPRDVGVRDLAQALGMPPSTVHRTLRQLLDEGLLETGPANARYHFGLRLFRLAWAAASRFPITEAALPAIRELVDACGETAFLALYDRGRMEMILPTRVESNHPLRYEVELNRWLPVYAGAGGLAIMAFLPGADRATIVARTGLRRVTPRTVTDPKALEREVQKIRRRGYALTAGQRVPGAVGVGAPIWAADGRVIGAVVVTVPAHRFKPPDEPKLARLVCRAAATITARIGGRRALDAGADSRDA
jgi:DNA-binding IclR family transcriptional regulator